MATQPRVSPPEASTGNIVRDSALGLVPETLEPYIGAQSRAVGRWPPVRC